MQKLVSKTSKAISFADVGVYYPRPVKNIFRKREQNDGFWALKDVTFEIEEGDVLGIIGNNGAGKSTTLSLISGIISQSKGLVETYGNKSTLLSINAGFSSSLSGRKNIMLLGLSLGIRRQVITASMDEIIAFSELEDFIDEPVETYSSGMKARLGFSTALVLQPDILLIDEVLGVGDRNFKKKSNEAIKEKLRGNSTAVVVSHSERIILALCNKVLWLDKGISMAFGDPDKVVQEYIAFCESA
ncbi:MAG: ABC transporter ATP-binding protein [Bdellovibrionota bacterium]